MNSVLVVEDFEPFREFVSALLREELAFQVVSEASDGFEAVHCARELNPDLILLDLGLPGLNGIEVARQIGRSCQTSKIVFLTENRSRDVAEEALQAGAVGYVVKSHAEKELIPALKNALNARLVV